MRDGVWRLLSLKLTPVKPTDSHGHFKFVPQSHFHKRFFESSMLWFSSTVRYKQSSKVNSPEKVSERRREFDQLGWPDDQRQHHFSL